MKIGILTFHDGINHGAFLQAYSLQETLKKYGHEVKIINYKSKFHHWNEYQKFLLFKPFFTKKSIKKRFENLLKILKFKKTHKKFHLTKFSYEIDKICKKENFDLVVLGSDEIWNYKSKLCGFDLTFFGKNVTTKKLVSYAPSFGQINYKENLPEDIIVALQGLDKISVRDTNSQRILDKYNLPSLKVLDPTFLFDIPLNSTRPVTENYILVYLNSIEKKNISEIQTLAKHTGKILVAIGYEKGWCDKNFVAINPYEWIDFFGYADYVITNTFHGTIFSIKHRKRFAVLNPGLKSIKITSLLEDLNLTSVMTEHSADLTNILNSDYQYDEIYDKLQTHINLSQEFLLTCTSQP
jgi:hypothetical protein